MIGTVDQEGFYEGIHQFANIHEVIEKLDPTSAMIGDESPYVQMFGKTEYVPHAAAHQHARHHACEVRTMRTCDVAN
jgi:hypothetical protein